MADFAVVTEVLNLLLQTKPGTSLADNTVEGYTAVLEPISNEVLIEAAIILARKPGAFVPDAGTIFQTALGLMDEEPDVDLAWQAVVERARGRRDIELGDRAERALAAIGGCGGWLETDLPFRRKEFIEAYKRQEQAWRDQAALPGGQAWKLLTP